MTKIFSICNQKGGVGKTTSTINIATALSEAGYKVLLIDLDAQANTTSGVGNDKPEIESTSYQLFVENSDINELIVGTPVENLDLVPSNLHLAGIDLEIAARIGREFILKSQFSKINTQYDFILIDCPPSLGLITINALNASKYVIIPMQCEYYALEGLGQLLQTYHLVKQNLNTELDIGGVLLTMADLRTNLAQQVVADVKEHFKEKVFRNYIPRSVKLSEAPSFGKPAIQYDRHNKGSQAYLDVAEEFIERFADEKRNVSRETKPTKVDEESKESAPVEHVTQEEKPSKEESVS